MKKNILSFGMLILIACLISCQKDVLKGNKKNSRAIIGTWELRESSAAMTTVGGYYPPGNGNILKFSKDYSYEIYTNGLLVKVGQYKIVSDLTVEENVCLVFAPEQFTHRIIYNTDYNAPKEFIDISNNELTFVAGCYALDGSHSSTYKKIK